MDEFRELINVGRRERDLLYRTCMRNIFWDQDEMTYLYLALQTPCLPDSVDEWLSGGTFVRQPGGIGKLSTEVLDMIFQAILDNALYPSTTNLLSCVCFSVTCKRLLTVGKRHILKALVEHFPRAADCRLVFLGEGTDATDQAPQGMLTDDELKEIAETKIKGEDSWWAVDARTDPDVIPERCLYNFAAEHYASAHKAWFKRYDDLMQARLGLWKHARRRRGRAWEEDADPLGELDEEMVNELAGILARYPAGPNVLLNLVKGEYVRETALVVLGDNPEWATLAHAVVVRVCYSQLDRVIDADESCGEEELVGFGRGPWAGDRFRIVNEDDMSVPQEGCGFAEWADVTEEVNRLLESLWRAMDCEGQLAERAQADASRDAVYVAGTGGDCVCC